MSDQAVPILVYHHVYPEAAPELESATGDNAAGIIGVAQFERHLQYLDDNDWTVVSTTQIIDWLGNGAGLPERAVALHFDNGWLDTFEVVLPMLANRGFAATCFPITDGIEAASAGRSAAVHTLTECVVEKPFMTWGQVQKLLDAGWEIGAHTATHCKVADRHQEEGDAGVAREAEDANALFRRHLGFTPAHFAYPSGSRNDRTDQLLSAYYRSLRLWHFEWPIHWSFTRADTPADAIDCQNIDLRVSFADFQRIFAPEGSS